jgi:hypothetical protein
MPHPGSPGHRATQIVKADKWRIPDHPTSSNMRQNYLYLLEHIADFKQDRISEGSLSADELCRMSELKEAGLVRMEMFNTTNAGKIRNLAPYYLLTDTGSALISGRL